MLRAAVAGVFAVLLAVVPGRALLAQEEGDWVIRSMTTEIAIGADGLMTVDAEIVADFGSLEKHGIFYKFLIRQPCGDFQGEQPIYDCPGGSDREYPTRVESVQDADGRPVPFESKREGGELVLRIGDPGRTVQGVQTYRVRYTVEGALNAFETHDELYWNITGQWDVPIQQYEGRLTLPDGADIDALCFEGYRSQAQCEAEASGNTAVFRSTRVLYPDEEVTIAAGWQKGIIEVGPPLLADRVSIDDFFTLDVWEFAGAGVAGGLGLLAVVWAWWRYGRARRYTTIHYLTGDPTEETKPVFGRTDIVVEFLPPEQLRPAQMGVLLDEKADTLDVTATIVDLAVRGYLRIKEVPKQGWFGKPDWELERLKEADGELVLYESALHQALFKERESVTISALKQKFYKDLESVKKALYDDSVERKWFTHRPETARRMWAGIGIGAIVVAVGVAAAAGWLLERALIGAPLIIAGLLLLALSPAMSRRTAAGSEALRRVLGFRLYVDTAEKRQHEFNEEQNIFARYLPYAIVFESVDKWAKAFEGMDDVASESTAGWYVASGGAPFRVAAFTAGLSSFSNGVSSSIASTPGGSGGSGFGGGGFSGGGGGGGHGGSW